MVFSAKQLKSLARDLQRTFDAIPAVFALRDKVDGALSEPRVECIHKRDRSVPTQNEHGDTCHLPLPEQG